MKRKEFQITAFVNKVRFDYYLTRLLSVARGQFIWNGFPASVNTWFIEKVLSRRGSICFFIEEELDKMIAMRYTTNSELSIYDLPASVVAYSANSNYSSIPLEEDARVLCFDNNMHSSIMVFLEFFAYTLADIDSAINVNTRAQKTPIVILCDEKERLALQNLMMAYDGNVPTVYAKKNLDLSKFSTIDCGIEYKADKLQQLKSDVWNDALSFLGVNNLSIQKRERMLSDEIKQMMGGTIYSKSARLIPRLQACEEINDKFKDYLPTGKVSVKLSEELFTDKGEFDVELYNNYQNDL